MCKGIYFCESKLSAAQIMEDLKSDNKVFLSNLEILLRCLDFKKQSQTFTSKLEDALKDKEKIVSMNDLF
jgi:hypothetical protein